VETIVNSIPLIFATYYLVTIFLLEKKTSHEGPFILPDVYVWFREEEDDHIQRASIFDIVRLLFGVYQYDSITKILTVKNRSWLAELWTCPICLSFWMSLVVCLLTGNANPVTVLCVAGGSALCVNAVKS
jgi:hypothetical protein